MNERLLAILNQQLMTGRTLGQQGMLAEMQGNYAGAAQSYDQAVAWIYQSVTTAHQSGVYVPDHIHFTFAFAHFSAARAKSLLGWAPMAWNHLNQSLAALNRAIAINPNVVQYHVAAGTVLMTLGNLPEAERAFNTVLQLNPSEPSSQYMLAVLNSARGNMAAANYYYVAVQQVAPNIPPMPVFPHVKTPGQGTDWMNTVNNACTMLNNVFKTIGNFQDLMQQF
jgi:tetratricopeptide (TPR) repeat protein